MYLVLAAIGAVILTLAIGDHDALLALGALVLILVSGIMNELRLREGPG